MSPALLHISHRALGPVDGGATSVGTLVEVWEHDRLGRQLYHHAWFTDLEVTADNVAAIERIGRSRWKSENAHFNVHKNHGYELEHNYGHGQQTLSMVFYLLNLLAFIAHGILERGDRRYQRCLATTSRRELWHTLRTAMRMLLVTAWIDFLVIYLDEAGPRRSGPLSTQKSRSGRREASARSTEEKLRHAPMFLVSCPRQNTMGVFRYGVGHLGV